MITFVDVCKGNEVVDWTIREDSTILGAPFNPILNNIASRQECQQQCLYWEGCRNLGNRHVVHAFFVHRQIVQIKFD